MAEVILVMALIDKGGEIRQKRIMKRRTGAFNSVYLKETYRYE